MDSIIGYKVCELDSVERMILTENLRAGFVSVVDGRVTLIRRR